MANQVARALVWRSVAFVEADEFARGDYAGCSVLSVDIAHGLRLDQIHRGATLFCIIFQIGTATGTGTPSGT